ncbi:MAG: Lrp/AsnC family transcriptional regulator [Candidatus Atabeyarchaeum deiterrae]
MKNEHSSKQISQTDVEILKVLISYARLSSRQIAQRIGVSTATVITRIKAMEQEKIIKGYTAVLDQEKLGYELTVISEITVSKGKLLEMEKEIARIPNVCGVYDVTGVTDAMVIAKFRNRAELSNFTKTVLALPFIERSNTHVVLTTVKEDYRLL